MSQHAARTQRQGQIRGEMVDVNELRAQRAAALQQDFPLGTRNAPSTGIRVPDPTSEPEAGKESPKQEEEPEKKQVKDNN